MKASVADRPHKALHHR